MSCYIQLVRVSNSTTHPYPADSTLRLVPHACQVLTLPTFPTSVMGTVVNKRAKYSYLRLVQNSEKLTYRCVLDLQEGSQPCATHASVYLQP